MAAATAAAADVKSSPVSAAIAGFKYRSRTVQCMSQDYSWHNVHYLDWGNESNPNVLVCVHGLTRNAHDFDFFAARMSEHYRVVCVDMPGRGGSERLKNRAHYDYKQYVSDMTTVLAHIQPNSSTAPALNVSWVGMSMGGIIGFMIASLTAASTAGCPINRLVLVDIGPILPKDALHFIAKYVGVRPKFKSIDECTVAFRERYGVSWGPYLTEEHIKYLVPHSFHRVSAAGAAEEEWDWIFDPAIGVQVAETTALVTADVDMTYLWKMITIPTLVLHGADSTILTADICKRMASEGPKATVIDYPSTGHLPPLLGKDITDIEAWLNANPVKPKVAATATAAAPATAAAGTGSGKSSN